MIPKQITREHVRLAAGVLCRNGVPQRHESHAFRVEVDEACYPPKYLISDAARIATGRALSFAEFGGGNETNSYLRRLGFRVSDGPSAVLRSLRASGLRISVRLPRVARVTWARLIITKPRDWSGSAASVRRVLDAVFQVWPREVRASVLLAPGGFLSFPWPHRITRSELPDRFEPPLSILKELRTAARDMYAKCIEPLSSELAERTDVLSMGVDAFSDHDELGVELIVSRGSGTGREFWSGKVYPTVSQQASLVRYTDIPSHFATIAGLRTLILGCHDLKIFDPRAQAVAGQRRQRIMRSFIAEAKRFCPEQVLQHPHSTDSPAIWRNAWKHLLRTLPTVQAYASAGVYSDCGAKPRRPLSRVLAETAQGTTMDFVFA